MRVAVGAIGNNLDSSISKIFGRSYAFIIVDLENGEIKGVSAIDNPAKNESGAGNTAAQLLVDHDVDVLIAGKLGPIAFHILKNEQLKVYKSTKGNVEKNLKRFIEGKLDEITSLSGGFV
ncbi:MAG: NifB/NifX family molybdenum-iron cluster-binding protein [Methanobacterium sp.]